MEIHVSTEMTEILALAEMSYTEFMKDFENYCEGAGVIASQEALQDYFEHLKIFYL